MNARNAFARAALAVALLSSPLAPELARAACPAVANNLLASPVTTTVGNSPLYMAAADFNGDGRPDLAVCEYSSNQLSVYLNFPEPASSTGFRIVLGARVTGLSGARHCAVGDFDENGVPDIAVACLNNSRLAVLLGSRAQSGYALAAPALYVTSAAARYVTVADLDADGVSDLVVGHDSGLQVFRGMGVAGLGTGVFAAPQSYETNRAIFAVTVADLNGDGALDLGCGFGPYAGGAVLFGQRSGGVPTGTFGPEQLVTFSGLAKSIRAADMNADGRTDLVVSVDPGVVVVQNNTAAGSATFAYAATRFQNLAYSDNSNDAGILDLDHDGVLDIILPISGAPRLSILRGAIQSGAWTVSSLLERGTATGVMVGLELADWNGDGRLDVITSCAGAAQVQAQLGLCSAAPAGQVAVSAIAEGPGTVSMSPAGPFFVPSTSLLCSATPTPGAQFLGWSGALSGVATPQSLAPSSDTLVRGWFATSSRALDVQVDGDGTVTRSLDLPVYPADAGLLLLARPAVGFAFSGWSGAVSSADTLLSLGTAASGVLTAHFVPAQYTLQVSVNTAGHNSVTIDPVQATYTHGQQVVLTATSEYGYTFTKWTGIDAGTPDTARSVTVTMTANRVVTANFTPVKFPVTISVLGFGSVYRSPSDTLVAYNSTLLLSAEPSFGYRFFAWSGDLVSNAVSVALTVTGPMHITAMFEGAPEYLPTITSLTDSPNDQGGQLRVRWSASLLDHVYSWETYVNRYYLWRSVPTAGALAALTSGAARWYDGDGDGDGGGDARKLRAVQFGATTTFWEFVAVVNAMELGYYTTTVPTESDSSAAGLPWTKVFVQARSADGQLWWNSPIDSMYSVDNLAPPPPSMLAATRSPAGLHLRWSPSVAADLVGYRVYRGQSAGFVTDAASFVGATSGTAFDLPEAPQPNTHVKVVAVDAHDNMSAAAVLTPATLDALVAPAAFALRAPRPNPSRGVFDVAFTLAREGDATIEVVDVSGRAVRRHVHAGLPAGEHRALLGGPGTLTPGLYFVRLTQGEQHALRRIVIVR
ncbi:MAG: VCBS repeat-containing protein [Candidatus Eisenbacteria bacterium]|uniref:VCBS repeat-containing protein n=1 Tax=Eiseniibacteriota bacterium TaxID=2212470 RepID=A0A933SAY1_UNCEI|nr:VCBS repeat-containing protein [Candidatus Eisenbacteria bacterium]